MEYIIELLNGSTVVGLVNIERDNRISKMSASESGYNYCTKFRSKERAERYATKASKQFGLSSRVGLAGVVTKGSKHTVPEKQLKHPR